MVDYISGLNGSDLFVPAKAATIYSAHEQSLFLGGEVIPVVNAPNGVLQVPTITKGAATTVSAENDGGSPATSTGDIANILPTIGSETIAASLFAARSVVRDLGNVDPNEIGRSLGMSVAAAFDAAVMTKLKAGLTGQDLDTDDTITIADIAEAVGAIRGAGETGPLVGLVSATDYASLMVAIGNTAYAGGDVFQGQALRSGSFGQIMGVQLLVTSYLDNGVAIMGQDAMRIGMQRNVDLEIARRAEAVGVDCVASLMAGVGVVDGTRGRWVKNAA